MSPSSSDVQHCVQYMHTATGLVLNALMTCLSMAIGLLVPYTSVVTWLLHGLCFLYVVQLSCVTHSQVPAALFTGVSANVPWPCYVPFAGFAWVSGLYYFWTLTSASTLWLTQAGFLAQLLQLTLAAFVLFLPHPGYPLLATAFGYLAYMFAYPHLHPGTSNEFQYWTS